MALCWICPRLAMTLGACPPRAWTCRSLRANLQTITHGRLRSYNCVWVQALENNSLTPSGAAHSGTVTEVPSRHFSVWVWSRLFRSFEHHPDPNRQGLWTPCWFHTVFDLTPAFFTRYSNFNDPDHRCIQPARHKYERSSV